MEAHRDVPGRICCGASMDYTIRQLAQRIGAEIAQPGTQGDVHIEAVAPIATAGQADVTFAMDEKHRSVAAGTGAAAIIVSSPIEGLEKPQLIVGDVNAALIEALKALAPELKPACGGVDASAKIGRNVQIDASASVGAYVVVEDGAEIGAGTVIGSGCKIGENSVVGEDCRLDSNVVVYHNCRIGSHVIIQANTTIGSTGFGYSTVDGTPHLIPHNGGVIIEDYVEIGANCCVDRAKFGSTIVGAGTKVDNLVQIAHNVVIGKCCLIAALVGVSGSCRLGDGVVLAGQVGLADNIEIGDGVQVGAQSGVLDSVPAGKQLAWTPAIDKREALRVVGLALRLPKMASQVKQLSKRVEHLEASEDDKK